MDRSKRRSLNLFLGEFVLLLPNASSKFHWKCTFSPSLSLHLYSLFSRYMGMDGWTDEWRRDRDGGGALSMANHIRSFHFNPSSLYYT